jgi:hypothetical protein
MRSVPAHSYLRCIRHTLANHLRHGAPAQATAPVPHAVASIIMRTERLQPVGCAPRFRKTTPAFLAWRAKRTAGLWRCARFMWATPVWWRRARFK